MRNHPRISIDTPVIVRRTLKNSSGEHNEHGPKTISQAIRDNDLTTSSGTVQVSITVAAGPHAGANVYSSGDRWFAQYDPGTQHADGSALFEPLTDNEVHDRDAVVHLRVPAEVKARWVRMSRADGQRLGEWLVERIERALRQEGRDEQTDR